MTQPQPKISSLNPVVLPDNRRIMMEMVVDNLPLPPGGETCAINFFDTPPVTPPHPHLDFTAEAAPAPSPYPDVHLSVLDSQRREVASLIIIEHREPHTALTLHLRVPNPQEQYTARAAIILNQTTLDVAEIPFTLHPH